MCRNDATAATVTSHAWAIDANRRPMMNTLFPFDPARRRTHGAPAHEATSSGRGPA